MGDQGKKLDSRLRPIVAVKKPGRNEPCPCGSGKKFKRCCKEIPHFLGPTSRRQL